ncbi:hypothetical protein BOX15_Mlig002262g1, partial [Macrostomum lignano]
AAANCSSSTSSVRLVGYRAPGLLVQPRPAVAAATASKESPWQQKLPKTPLSSQPTPPQTPPQLGHQQQQQQQQQQQPEQSAVPSSTRRRSSTVTFRLPADAELAQAERDRLSSLGIEFRPAKFASRSYM